MLIQQTSCDAWASINPQTLLGDIVYRVKVLPSLLYAIPLHYFVADTNGIDLRSRSFFVPGTAIVDAF